MKTLLLALALLRPLRLRRCLDDAAKEGQDLCPVFRLERRRLGPPVAGRDGGAGRPRARQSDRRSACCDDGLLARGQQRYQIFCAPCHGLTGEGDGIVVKRGFPAPPPFDLARLRQAPRRHIFDVISDGYGVMYPFASRVPPEDRWAIVVYVRALQLADRAPDRGRPRSDGEVAMSAVATSIRPPIRPAPIIIGVVGCALLAAWGIFAPRGVLQGWLIAFVIIGGAPLGALALLCVARLTGGRWAVAASPRLFCAVAATPLLCLAFLPVLFGAGLIFPWASDAGAAGKNVAQWYLNTGFFALRGAQR